MTVQLCFENFSCAPGDLIRMQILTHRPGVGSESEILTDPLVMPMVLIHRPQVYHQDCNIPSRDDTLSPSHMPGAAQNKVKKDNSLPPRGI